MKDFEQAKARGSAPGSTDLRALQVALIGYGEVGTPRRSRADRGPGADDREEGRSTESAGGTAAYRASRGNAFRLLDEALRRASRNPSGRATITPFRRTVGRSTRMPLTHKRVETNEREEEKRMMHVDGRRRRVLQVMAAAFAAHRLPLAHAADALKIGLILPLTGPFASTGRQVEAACRLYIQKNGDTAGGRKIELIVRDDTGVAPETTKRIAQELLVRDRAEVLAGFGLTPLALAAAPVATEAKAPMIVMAAATSIVTSKSPYIVRSGFTLPQVTAPIADWAPKNKIKTVVTLATDYAPGLDAEGTFVKRFTAGGGKILDSLRVPLRNPDYGPFIQRAKDAKPDALFVFVPSGEGSAVMKQFNDRGLKEAGIQMIGTGDVVDDDLLESMGAVAVGVVTSFHYSAAHDSPENKAYVDGFMKANPGMRPNFHSVGGYDGMHLIYQALAKTNGDASGDKFVEAAKGLSWTSPRGPMTIDPATRDPVQTVYIRRVEMVNGKPWSIEFDKIENMKDPSA